MAVDVDRAPTTTRPTGEPCCEPVDYPDVDRDRALRLAEVAKALGDPIRLQLVDVLRRHAGKVCVCELVALFDISQPTLSHHLKKLREAGIVDSERQGLWAYYYVLPGALHDLAGWLDEPAATPRRPTSQMPQPALRSAVRTAGLAEVPNPLDPHTPID
jgi:ArsR family transcriptional regulator